MKNLTLRVLMAFLGLLMLVSPSLLAKPVAAVQSEDVVVTLYDDKCQLDSRIITLPYKATWLENGKQIQGCFGVRPDLELIVTYFEDGSVALIPMGMFKPAKEV